MSKPIRFTAINKFRHRQHFANSARCSIISAGESPSWLRHRILIPAREGSNPSSPANFPQHRSYPPQFSFFRRSSSAKKSKWCDTTRPAFARLSPIADPNRTFPSKG
jgi:hypothetical protein